jgi:hypothetical protein
LGPQQVYTYSVIDNPVTEAGCEVVDQIHLTQGRIHWWPFVNTIVWNFLTTCEVTNYSRRLPGDCLLVIQIDFKILNQAVVLCVTPRL